MGCCLSKPCSTTTSTIPNGIAKDYVIFPSLSSSAPSIHPCRLVELDDISFELRFFSQLNTAMNRNMNSPFVFSEEESCRRPDLHTILLLTPQILDEVEQSLMTDLTTGWLHTIVNSDACYSFKAVSFKRSQMKKSQLGAAAIEAALANIIEHLDEHPKVVAALGTAKIGYHDNGMAIDDVGVRTFVVKGFKTNNLT